MPETVQGYKTSDMALVAYLRCVGCTPARVEWDATIRTCFWYYENADDTFVTLLVIYAEDKAQVNPRAYTRQFASTKREFYAAKET